MLDKQSYQALLQSKQHDEEAEGCEAKEDREKEEYKIRCGLLGIGNSRKTWYGTPDARCRGGSSETNMQAPSTSGSSTPGNTTVIEAKIDAQPMFLNL